MKYFTQINEHLVGINKETKMTSFLKRWYVCIPIFAAAFLAASYFAAKFSNTPIEYVAINGDFQTYNMFRRLLDGQVPFSDFVVYLGFGPLYLGSIFTAFSNTLYSSMMIVSVISSIMFVFTLCLCFYIVSKNIKRSILISLLIPVIVWVISIPMYWYMGISVPKGTIYTILYQILEYIVRLMSSGNSMRTWRGFIAIVVSFALLYFINRRDNKIRKFLRNSNFYIASAVCGAIAGCIIPWSNDFGISSYIAISFTFFVWMLMNRKAKEVVLGTLIYSICTLICVYGLINIFTVGNFEDWFNYNLAVSDYQSWYFETHKNLSLATISMNFYIIIYIIVIALNLYKIFHSENRRLNINYVYLFLLSSALIAAFLYQIGSCSRNILPNAYWLLDIFALCYIIHFLVKKALKKVQTKRILVTSVYLFIFLSALFIGTAAKDKENMSIGKYVGGYIDAPVADNGYSLEKIDALIGDRSYFTTYATGLEALRGEFHPTRFDYIIHALGDDSREEYLDNFLQNDYDCVLTIHPNYINWEGWIQNANWYFYRHIYSEYTPQKSIGYNMFWEKGSSLSIDTDTDVELIRLSDSKVKIIVNSSCSSDCIADVKISYETDDAQSKIFSTVHHSMVEVELNNPYIDKKYDHLYNLFFIPKQASEYYIPIYISNGRGHAVLTYLPEENGTLNINSVSVENVFENAVHKSDENTIVAPRKYDVDSD